jgi:hypothetical protein
MGTRTIDTTSQGYQNRLQQLREIKTFYGPVLAEYAELPGPLDAEGGEAQAWRQADPILREFIDVWRKLVDRDKASMEGW